MKYIHGDDIIDIINKYKNGISKQALATEYNVEKTYINTLVINRTKEEERRVAKLAQDSLKLEALRLRQRAYARKKYNHKGTTKPWTEDEVDILIEIYPTTKVKDIAIRLGRTYGAVTTKCYKMKLRKYKKCKLRNYDKLGKLIKNKINL